MMSEPIHGFNSPGEFNRFSTMIDDEVRSGAMMEIEPDPNYQRGQLYGGRWFRVKKTGEVWRLIAPDYPFLGLWEPVLELTHS
jgi:hypothetical protein